MKTDQLKSVYRLKRLFTAFNSQRVTKNTRNSSGDEIANVNFLYDDIAHELQNTIDSCIQDLFTPP